MLTDVANVVDDVENIKQAAWMNRRPAVIVNIQRQPGANIIEVVDRIKAAAAAAASFAAVVRRRHHPDRPHHHHPRVGRGRAVRADADRIGLVVMVIFLFLRTLSATIIPSVAVPLSLIGTFAVMYLLGYSLNNLTLMALTISTGFVVDDAIVMIENIARYIEEGETPLQAALKGAEQIGFTIISLTISLIAVLIPLLFMGDIVGPAVPRVCRHAERDDPGFGGRVADADADDVRAAAEAHGRSEARTVLPGIGEGLSSGSSHSTARRSNGFCGTSR